MKTICFYFQIHQPFRLKRYRFFDIGNDHYYYDDFQNEEIIHRIAEQCYLPANRTILEMIKTSGGKFKVAFSISGVALEQMEIYTPEVIAPPCGQTPQPTLPSGQRRCPSPWPWACTSPSSVQQATP